MESPTNTGAPTDDALLILLRELKTATAPPQIQDLSAQIERQIFHRQLHSQPKP